MDTLVVTGGSSPRRKEVKAIATSVLKNNFTQRERKEIGPVKINLSNNLGKSFAADTGRVRGVTDIRLGKGIRKPDLPQVITHELVHTVRRAEHRGYKSEKKTDLEVMGRLSPTGVKGARLGYYFSEKLKFPPHTPLSKKISLVRKDIVADRRSLTGSVQKSMEGSVLQKRVDVAYKNSKIACRKGFR
jgi:hypothetical protein